MDNDLRAKAVVDFCEENGVTVIVDDEWKTREKKLTLRKGKWAVVRRISYDAIPTLLIITLLDEMLREIPEEEGET